MTESTHNTRDLSAIVKITDASQNNPSCNCYNRFVGLDSNGKFVSYLDYDKAERLQRSGQATLEVKNDLHSDDAGPCYIGKDDQIGYYEI
jgi:hypothetical protein